MGFQFLRLRISECHNKIKKLHNEIDALSKSLTDKLTEKELETLRNVVGYNTFKVEKSLQANHQKKQERLSGDFKRRTSVDKDRWIVNLSNRQLNQQETQVLQRGLNFSITPRNVPVAKMLASVESGIYNLEEPKKTRNSFIYY